MDYNQLNPCDQGLLNNNFLRYGWRRYKHALIGKDTKRNCYILGVPGTYNRQEALMAGMFGFPYFKEAKCETTEMSAQEVQGHLVIGIGQSIPLMETEGIVLNKIF